MINSWLSRPRNAPGPGLAGLWLLALSGVLACAGVVCLFIAFDTWMTALYGPVMAALATALGAFVLSGIAAASFHQRKARVPASAAHDESLTQTAEALFAVLNHATEGLETPIAENPRTSVALASLAGYMAAHKMH